MVIMKYTTAYNQLCTFAQDKWDKVGNLVKYIVDNNLEDMFDDYVTEEYPNGCGDLEFEDFCCNEAEDIIKHLKGE